jgi:hypothetical protein
MNYFRSESETESVVAQWKEQFMTKAIAKRNLVRNDREEVNGAKNQPVVLHIS